MQFSLNPRVQAGVEHKDGNQLNDIISKLKCLFELWRSGAAIVSDRALGIEINALQHTFLIYR